MQDPLFLKTAACAPVDGAPWKCHTRHAIQPCCDTPRIVGKQESGNPRRSASESPVIQNFGKCCTGGLDSVCLMLASEDQFRAIAVVTIAIAN